MPEVAELFAKTGGRIMKLSPAETEPCSARRGTLDQADPGRRHHGRSVVTVIPVLVTGIQRSATPEQAACWIPGTRPGMTAGGAMRPSGCRTRPPGSAPSAPGRARRPARDAHQLGGHLVVVRLDVVRHVALGALDGFQHQRQSAWPWRSISTMSPTRQRIAGDGDPAAVDRHMAVADELARGEHRRHELGAIDHGVEAALQQADHVLGRRALRRRGFLVDAAELTLADVAVIALELLLGAQLLAVVRQLAAAPLAVLAGAVLALVDRALGAAPDVLADAAVDLVLGANALGHVALQKSR